MKNSKKKQTRETKQSLEDSDMTLMLELSEREYKIICYRMNEENQKTCKNRLVRQRDESSYNSQMKYEKLEKHGGTE